MLPDISRERQLAILRKMLMIRRAEEHCIRFNDEHTGLIRGHFHVYIGQEATGVSVCDWLNAEDYVFTTHRNHGHVIAKGGDPKKVLAEIIGRSWRRSSAAPPATARDAPGRFTLPHPKSASSIPPPSLAVVSPWRAAPLTRPRSKAKRRLP